MTMSMTFEASSSVTLLFDFWNVRGPAGMVLSVLVVLLLTVFYELLKVFRVWLRGRCSPRPLSFPTASFSRARCRESNAALASISSQVSLTRVETNSPVVLNSWFHHGLQTVLHVLQVTLGYMLMLCVMSYNVWIFLGVLAGSVLGYFLAFPLLGQAQAVENR